MTEKEEVVAVLSTAHSGLLSRKEISPMAEVLHDAGLWRLMPKRPSGVKRSCLSSDGRWALKALHPLRSLKR